MTSYLHDRVLVVTGAASGFGKLVTGKAMDLGAKVVAADVDEQGLEALQQEHSNRSDQLRCQITNVTSRNQMLALTQHAVDEFGQLDIMLNNAGVMPLAYYSDHEAAADAWDRCIDINFKGVLNGIAASHDHMIRQGRGHVVNLSSIYGNHPVSGGGVYGATKAAVNVLSESLRQESQGKIKVTTVKPTGVPATGLGAGVINPEAVAGILGANAPAYMQLFAQAADGTISADLIDANNIEYFALDPDYLAEQIVHVMNQPWGVVISDITVRASGDAYVI